MLKFKNKKKVVYTIGRRDGNFMIPLAPIKYFSTFEEALSYLKTESKKYIDLEIIEEEESLT